MTSTKSIYGPGYEQHVLNPGMLVRNAEELHRLEQQFYEQSHALADMLGYYMVPPEEGHVWAVQSCVREKNLIVFDVANLGKGDEPFDTNTIFTEVKNRHLFVSKRAEVLTGFYPDMDIFPISRVARRGTQLLGISAVTDNAAVEVNKDVRFISVSQGEINKRVNDIKLQMQV